MARDTAFKKWLRDSHSVRGVSMTGASTLSVAAQIHAKDPNWQVQKVSVVKKPKKKDTEK